MSAFDRTKAQLSETQLDLAEAIDKVYELGRQELTGEDEGFQIDDLFALASASAHLKTIVSILMESRALGGLDLANTLSGAAAAFFNDNLDELRPNGETDEPSDTGPSTDA